MEQEQVDLGHSVCDPLSPVVSYALCCSGWQWQDCPRDQGGRGIGFSVLKTQSSPVECSVLLHVTQAAGLIAESGASTMWLWFRLAAWFWGLGCDGAQVSPDFHSLQVLGAMF